MPLKGFKYPNGDKVSIEDIHKGNVDVERMGITTHFNTYVTTERSR